MPFRLLPACWAFVCAAGFSAAATAGEPLPFKATFAAQEVLGMDTSACPMSPFLHGTTTGSGASTLLGKTTLLSNDCVTPVDGTTFIFTDGTLVLTGANGDTVIAVYSGSLIVDSAPFYTLAGSYRVTGGTGRFAGATGSGSLTGRTNVATGKGRYDASGTITVERPPR